MRQSINMPWEMSIAISGRYARVSVASLPRPSAVMAIDAGGVLKVG
jgi:hypothetical protein